MKNSHAFGARSGMTRRAALVSSAGAIGLLASPGILRAAGTSEITVTTYGGGFEKVMREKIVPAFEAANPSYKVNIQVTDESDTISKLVVARDRPTYDAIMINHETGLLLQGAGLVMDDQTAKLPAAKEVYPSVLPPHAGVYGTTLYSFELVYDKRVFSTPPTSWRDLWKDGLTVGVPYVGQPYGITFLYVAALLNGGSATNLQPGFDAIKRLSNFKIYNNAGQGMQLFQQGEIGAAFYYSHRAQQMIDLGLPVGRAVPKEGAYAQVTGMQIPKSTKNLEGALAWVNFSLTPGFQQPLAELLYSPTNPATPLPAGKEAFFISNKDDIAALKNPPWNELLPQRDALLETWRKQVG